MPTKPTFAQRVSAFCEKNNLFLGDTIQQLQLQHRFALVDAFDIQPGMSVLEIGCGQGDTTVVLADAVGPTGRVVAIDIANGDYGAPLTLSQANVIVKASPLGERVDFHLKTDFLSFPIPAGIDAIILSHCAWYFHSSAELLAYCQRIAEHAPKAKLCIAEWDLAFTDVAQRAHFCAASILALHSHFIPNSGNIQMLFSKQQLVDIASHAGLVAQKQVVVDASFLQDGRWEGAFAKQIAPTLLTAVPEGIKVLVQSYLDVLSTTPSSEIKSLDSFVAVFAPKC